MALTIPQRQSHERVKGAVRKVIELYKAGYSISEIARKIYGDDSRTERMRVSRYIWYGKRLGFLNTNIQYDRERGEYIDVETGAIMGKEIRGGYIPHSSPVHPQDPFLGSYRTMQQLRASLNSSDRRVVDVLKHIDRLFGLLPDISRESVIRQDACLLGSQNAHLNIWISKIAVCSVIVALLYHAPSRLPEFIPQITDVYERVKPINAVRDCFSNGFVIPPQMMGGVMVGIMRLMTAILNGVYK